MDLKIKETGFKVPCPTYNCRNLIKYTFNVERAPGSLDIQLCEDCLRSLIRNAQSHFGELPDEEIPKLKARIKELEELEGTEKIEKLETKVSELEAIIEKQNADIELATKAAESEAESESEIEDTTTSEDTESDSNLDSTDARCGTCENQFSKKAVEPCLTCKKNFKNGKGYTSYKQRVNKEG